MNNLYVCGAGLSVVSFAAASVLVGEKSDACDVEQYVTDELTARRVDARLTQAATDDRRPHFSVGIPFSAVRAYFPFISHALQMKNIGWQSENPRRS